MSVSGSGSRGAKTQDQVGSSVDAARPQAHGPFALLTPSLTVFLSSFCVMVIELIAGRMISGNLGASLYTWTSVIGIVLAGLAVGNHVGGLLADRFDIKRTLSIIFMAASVAVISILWLEEAVGSLSALWMLSWPARVAANVGLVFFVPACMLGMISPLVAKMALDVGIKTGRTLGSVYSWGVVGSIFGTFLTGFYLVEWVGTTSSIMGVGVLLSVIAVFYRARSWQPWSWSAVSVLLFALATGSSASLREMGESLRLRKPIADNVIYYRESQYSFVKVIQSEESPNQRKMILDTLLHSHINMERPIELHYRYAKVFGAITKRLFPVGAGQAVDNLMIGGGGYVYPRYMEATYPGSRNDVVEIDPVVTDAAQVAFGLPVDTEIQSFHEDARVFVDRLKRQKREGISTQSYDIVYLDAFSNHNVPFQLTTVEFDQAVKEILKPEGAMLINMIDIFESGQFLGAVVNTLQEVFSYVYVFVEGLPIASTPQQRRTFVVFAVDQPFDTDGLNNECDMRCEIFLLSAQQREQLAGKTRLVLTDDYSPIENFLAPIVRASAAARAYDEWHRRIGAAVDAKEYERAVDLGREALAALPANPEFESVHANLITELGITLRSQGDAEEALALFREALDLDSSNKRARFGIIDCYGSLGRLEETLPMYDGLLDSDLVRYNYGNTLAQLGRFPEAAKQFEIVTQMNPDFANAYNNWGNTVEQMGDLEAAVVLIEIALKLEPDHPDALASLARMVGKREAKK